MLQTTLACPIVSCLPCMFGKPFVVPRCTNSTLFIKGKAGWVKGYWRKGSEPNGAKLRRFIGAKRWADQPITAIIMDAKSKTLPARFPSSNAKAHPSIRPPAVGRSESPDQGPFP